MTTVTKPHQWRSIVTLSAGQITASCSRRGTKICSRCCSIQCALGAECYDCNHLITQDCKPMPARKGRPPEQADLNFPRRSATQRLARDREAQEKSRIQCTECRRKVPQMMPFCGYCATPMPQRQMHMFPHVMTIQRIPPADCSELMAAPCGKRTQLRNLAGCIRLLADASGRCPGAPTMGRRQALEEISTLVERQTPFGAGSS